MTMYHFNGSIAIRYSGSLSVEADSLEDAKARLIDPGFDIRAAFHPNGCGDDDFNFILGRYQVYAQDVLWETSGGDEHEADIDDWILTASEKAMQAGPALLDALQDLLEEAENTSAFEDALEGEDDAMLRAVEKARKAITKAGGVA
jgi:hypothetical protein